MPTNKKKMIEISHLWILGFEILPINPHPPSSVFHNNSPEQLK
jgi:hypothetical protein